MELVRYTADEMVGMVRREANDDINTGAKMLRPMNRWIKRGDRIAVYENSDLSHHELGALAFVSYGSPDAQLVGEEPPTSLPDIGTKINWRYQLIGTYQGDILNPWW